MAGAVADAERDYRMARRGLLSRLLGGPKADS